MESIEQELLNGPILFKEVKNKIKKYFHPEIEAVYPYPRGTFNISDLLRYMERDFGDIASRHFTPNYFDCLPCQIKYDYMMKIETMATDEPYVVHNKMHGVGENLALNVHRANKSLLANGGKELKIFRTVNKDLMDFALHYYRHDFPLYGYQFDRKTNIATCMNEDTDGNTCC